MPTTYPYGMYGAPVAGNGLGGLPRRATSGSPIFAPRNSSNYAIPGSVLWRNTATNQITPAGPIALSNITSTATLAGVYLNSIRTTISASIPTVTSACAYLPSGNLVVIGKQTGTNYVSFAILSPEGAVVVPITVIANENPSTVKVAASPNGNIVFAWDLGSNVGKYAIYSSAGAVVLAATQFAATGMKPFVACDSNNNFVISYGNASAFTAFQRFNSSGTQITAETSAITQVNNNTNSCVTFASNGNFIIVAPDDTNGRVIGAVFTSAAVSVGNVTAFNGGTGVSSVYVSAASTGGDWVVVWSSASVIQFARYNGITQQGTTVTLSPSATTGAFVQYLPSGSFVVGGCNTTGSSFYASATYTSAAVKVTGSDITTNAYGVSRGTISVSPLTGICTLSVIRSSSTYLYDLSPEFTSGSYVFDGISNFSGYSGLAYISGTTTIFESLGGCANQRAVGGGVYTAFGSLASVSL